MNGPKLDRIDIAILVQLQKNGQMTNQELSGLVGLSPSPCLQRVRRLERAGYIAGYGARINLAKLTETITVFTEITLSDHRREDFVKFERALGAIEELLECHLVSGGYDYLLRFVARSVAHYQEVIDALIDREIGVAKYFSYVVLKSPIVRAEAPITTLLGDRRGATE